MMPSLERAPLSMLKPQRRQQTHVQLRSCTQALYTTQGFEFQYHSIAKTPRAALTFLAIPVEVCEAQTVLQA